MSKLAPVRSRSSTFPVMVAVVWFGAVYLAGTANFFHTSGSEPPWRLGLAIVLPLGVVALVVWRSEPARAWVRGLDLQFLTYLQAWRTGGFVFVALFANGLLPASFAFPASLGDLAVALTAPFMARHLQRRGAAAIPLFLGWTVFGILDLVVAVTLGVLNSVGPAGILAGPVSTDLVTRMPVVLIPTFGVPLLLVLHMLSLIHLRAQNPLSGASSPGS